MEDGLTELVDAIYFAGLDIARWPGVVEQIGQLLGASAGLMMVPASFGAPALSYAAFGIRLDPSVADYYATIRGRATVTNRAIATGRAPGVFTLSELFPAPARASDDFWLRGLSPLNWTDGLVSVLRLPLDEEGAPVILNFFRDGAGGTMEAGAPRATMQALFPHLRRAMGLALTARTHAPGDTILGLLSAISDPVVALDEEGVVFAANPPAVELVNRRGDIDIKHRLRFANPVDDRQMQSAALRAQGPGTPCCDFVAGLGSATGPLYVNVSPIGRALARAAPSQRGTLVRLVDPTPGVSPGAIRLLRDTFGLTAAEAQIALALGAGRGPEDIAVDRQASIGTVRLQIKSALRKTQLSRQSALSALVARITR